MSKAINFQGPLPLLGLFTCVLLACSQQSCSTGEIQPSSVSVVLEDSVFLEGQSIFAITRFRNTGTTTLVDVSPLTLGAGYLRFTIRRKDTGELITSTPSGDHLGTIHGDSLPPGAVKCGVEDLTIYFGASSGDKSNISDRLGFRSLPMGEYVLRWEYSPSTSGAVGHLNRLIRGGPISFAVKALSTDPKEQALVADFLAGLPVVHIDRRKLHSYAREWLARFYGSKFLMRVYLSNGQLLSDLNFDEIYEGVAQAGAPEERRAALLGMRLRMTDTRNQFGEAWKAKIARTLGSELERDVLSIQPGAPSTSPNPSTPE